MRYTLSEEKHPFFNLFRVLDQGTPTDAFAKKGVYLSDGCNFRGGNFYDGEFNGGNFYDGFFYGGNFYGGNFHDGFFYGGNFYGGNFHGGNFHDGEFNGGIFTAGTFRDGWLPLQIQGSKHFVNIPDGKHLLIGCKEYTPEYWLDNFKTIGVDHGYTQEQIAEYKNYIDLATKIIQDNQRRGKCELECGGLGNFCKCKAEGLNND